MLLNVEFGLSTALPQDVSSGVPGNPDSNPVNDTSNSTSSDTTKTSTYIPTSKRPKPFASLSSVRRFLTRNDYRKLKSGSLPAKADVDKQREFYENVIHPLMVRAEKEEIELYFSDAAHFVLGNDYLGSIYCTKRRYTRTFSGRKRYNVLGAINFLKKEVLTVTNDKYITATEVCEMLRKLHAVNSGKEIYVALDNARYQKCVMVTACAAELNIHLVYIPPYSPNLNLIERLWRFVKNELRTKYYTDFDAFKAEIDAIISSTGTTNYDKICKLITEKVQLFDELEPVNPFTLEVVAKPA